MTRTTDKDKPSAHEDRRTAGTESPAKAKKVYKKPELSKYEQLHGIAIGLH